MIHYEALSSLEFLDFLLLGLDHFGVTKKFRHPLCKPLLLNCTRTFQLEVQQLQGCFKGLDSASKCRSEPKHMSFVAAITWNVMLP